jgi:ribosomal protein L40E
MVFIEPAEEAKIICLVCKAEMPAVARFCGKCGAPRAYAIGAEKVKE